ncbi:hypothetical protein NW767_009167 [Fusarium falciforme]|nr:hypothetical protein NW767_009167 [Fusarium falciforme]
MAILRGALRRMQTLSPKPCSAFRTHRRFHLPPPLLSANKEEPPATKKKSVSPVAQEILDSLREDKAEEQRALRERKEKEEQAFQALPWWRRYFKTAVKTAVFIRGS